MNETSIISAILLILFIIILVIIVYSLQDYISSVDDKVTTIKKNYVPVKKHTSDIQESKIEDSILHDRIDNVIDSSFDGEYDNLKNKPVLFDGEYDNLKNKPLLFDGKYDSLDNKPVLFDGKYDSLENKPVVFDGDYRKLKNKPPVVTDYNALTNKPVLFDGQYDSLKNKPVLFDGNYDSLTNKPTSVPTNWNNVRDKPDFFDGNYDSLTNKPSTFPTTWDNIADKPDNFSTTWDMVKNKPLDLTDPTGPVEYDDTELRELINGKAATVHTHNMNDINGITNSLSGYSLVNHTHTMNDIQDLSDNLNNKSDIGHQHDVSDINNLDAGYATKAELSQLTNALANKQGNFDSTTDIEVRNVNANGNMSVTTGMTIINNSSDTGVNRGIRLWHVADTNWAMYMTISGAGKAPDGGTAPAGHGFTAHAIRLRTHNHPTQGFIIENHSGQNNFSVRASDGLGYFRGSVATAGLNSSGNIYIRNNNPTLYLQDTDHRSAMIHCNSNILYFLRGNNTDSTTWEPTKGRWPLEIHLENNNAVFGGDISAAGNITAYFSDQRLKTKISKINNPLKIINSLNGFYYKPNQVAHQNGITHTDTEIGLSAQDVQKVLPELVKLAPFDRKNTDDGKLVSKSGQNYLTVCYERLVPVLVESVKELTQQNTDLQQKYNTLLQDMILIKQKLNLIK